LHMLLYTILHAYIFIVIGPMEYVVCVREAGKLCVTFRFRNPRRRER
jgi:hypothetical protein